MSGPCGKILFLHADRLAFGFVLRKYDWLQGSSEVTEGKLLIQGRPFWEEKQCIDKNERLFRVVAGG